ncbi:mechanosensitive ion channel family protein [Marinicella litoralis]|uniref:Small-conductance mechanosensitive channel n=1 Tax=Marinicella litoralis TaxID=644220 RepID=A0A4R6XTU5_9GAMM|nr:mechanosensitive ion channel family protein [Marinicella litoralis]TDR23395.1 BON domain-containing protein [Marinicella litoralis]
MNNILKWLPLLLFSGLLLAQEDESNITENKPSWSDTAQQIIVNQTVADQAIQQRFANILKISARIQDPEVEVTEGVLVLNGWTDDAADKKWVEEAANRTEGVIAVVNNIEVRLGEQWDLDPAFKEAMTLYDQFIRALPKISIALMVLILTWVLAKITVALATRGLGRKVSNPFVLRMGARLLAVPVVVIGLYLVLKLTGLTNLALTVVGGTGILGLVIGIAFKDIAENFLASILISIQRPFRIGDYILVDGHEGVVQSVTTRGTVIMTLEGNHIHIPNAIIYKNTIVNVTANPNIRQKFTVGIGYDDSITNAQQIALAVLLNHEAILKEPEPQVLVDNLGAATVNIIVYFWVDGQKNSASKVKSAMIRLIKKAFDEAKILMPDEAREVVFPEGIRIIQDSAEDTVKEPVVKSSEPQDNAVEADLSNDVDEIRKQSAENQLSKADDNLIKDEKN